MHPEGIIEQDSLLGRLPRPPHSETLAEEAVLFPAQQVQQGEWPSGVSLWINVMPQERLR
jgi:hypothetical protein